MESTFGARRVGSCEGRGRVATTPAASTRALSGDGAIGAVVPSVIVTGGVVTSLASLFARPGLAAEPSSPRPRRVSAETTVKAHQDLTGLVPGSVYFFRYRSATKAGVGDWSQVVSLLVA